MTKEKFARITSAFYACYDDNGKIHPKAVEEFTAHLIRKGVGGVCVGGSSAE